MSQVQGRRTVAVALILVAALSLLLIEPLPVHASGATIVQQNNNGCGNTLCSSATFSVSFSGTSSVTSGDVIVVGIDGLYESVVSGGVSDSKGSSFTEAASSYDGYEYEYVYYATLSSSGSGYTVTVTFSASTGAENVYIYEVSGVTVVGAGTGHDAGTTTAISVPSVTFQTGAFLLGMIGALDTDSGTTFGPPTGVTPGSGFSLSTENSGSGISFAQYAAPFSGTSSTFPATISLADSDNCVWAEAALALNPNTVVASVSTTSSASTTSSIQTPVSSTTTTVSESASMTNTLSTTTTTTGSVAGTSTTTFTSPFSTSYFTTSSVSSSTTSVTQTGTTTTGTVLSATTTSTGTTWTTYTSSGTVTTVGADTFNVLLTTIYQELEQFEAFILQSLGFQVTATPVGQEVDQVVVTVTTPTTSTASSTTVISSLTTTASSSTTLPSLTFTATLTRPLTATTLSPVVTKTVSTTTTTTGLAAGTSTMTFTSILSTATSTSTATLSTTSSSMTTLSATTTVGTTSTSSTSSATTFSTTTTAGTVTVSQTDTFTLFLTTIIQTLLKFVNAVWKLLGTRTVVTPKGEKVIRVVVTHKQ